jgi:hypothetical protein
MFWVETCPTGFSLRLSRSDLSAGRLKRLREELEKLPCRASDCGKIRDRATVAGAKAHHISNRLRHD